MTTLPEEAVKKLAWIRPPLSDTLSRCDTDFGTYRTWTYDEANGKWFWSVEGGWNEANGEAPNEEAAKAAAQADFEARILSALEPSADDCECTKIQQDETCPVGYPSLLCEICDGKGVVQPSAARKELMKQIREGTAYGFLNDGSHQEGNPDLDCPYCGGSGHKGDIQPSAVCELALVDALEVAKNELQAWIKCADENGLCVTSTPHVIDHIDIALASLSSPDHADAGKVYGNVLSQDVINLVIAAREFWDVANDCSDESIALDCALEAFASRVPYENEPED